MALAASEATRLFLSALTFIRRTAEDFYDPRKVARMVFDKVRKEGLPYSYSDVWSATSAASKAHDYAAQEHGDAPSAQPLRLPRIGTLGDGPGDYMYRVIVTTREPTGERHEAGVWVASPVPLSDAEARQKGIDTVLQDSAFNTRYERLRQLGRESGAGAVVIASYQGG